MVIGWPQGIWVVLAIFHLGATVALNGKPRSNYSIKWDIVGTVLATALLYWGGFFG